MLPIVVVMVYLTGLLIGLLLVSGQALWKAGIESTGLKVSGSLLFSSDLFRLLFSPYVLAGILIYLVATALYFYGLSKYEYSAIQSIVVAISLVLTFVIAKSIFGERLTAVNLVGLAALLVGTFLVGKK